MHNKDTVRPKKMELQASQLTILLILQYIDITIAQLI